MTFFDYWFIERMEEINYKNTYTHRDEVACLWMNFEDSNDKFHVMYLKAPMSPEAIRQVFDSHHEPVLFVVDVRAMPIYEHVSEIPEWIRVLHAVYYGRVYIYNDLQEHISACHFDWSADTRRYSEPIDLTGILFTKTDCQLRDFPGTFYIARFYDRAFWKEQTAPKQAPPKREKKQRTKPTEEDVYEAFARAFKEHMNRYTDYDYKTYTKQPPRNAPIADKWLEAFMSTGNLATARALYKRLAKEWHPDLNTGKTDAHETMQAINVAFSKVKEYLR